MIAHSGARRFCLSDGYYPQARRPRRFDDVAAKAGCGLSRHPIVRISEMKQRPVPCVKSQVVRSPSPPLPVPHMRSPPSSSFPSCEPLPPVESLACGILHDIAAGVAFGSRRRLEPAGHWKWMCARPPKGHSILALVESAHFRTSPGCFCPGPVQVFRRKCELPWSPLFTQGEFERPPRTGTSYQLARRFAVARGSQGLEFAVGNRRLLPSHLGSVYRCGPIVLGMVPTAQKHLDIADL